MIHSRGANGSDVELVFTQILQGFGGGLAAVSAQVGAQASVRHADVAIITALVLLFTEIGGAVGNACGGSIVRMEGSSSRVSDIDIRRSKQPVRSGRT